MKTSNGLRALAVGLALVAACSSSGSSTGSTGSTGSSSSGGSFAPDAEVDAAEPVVDGGGIDAETASDAMRPTDGCVVQRVAKSTACAADCGARLRLPAGDTYCTTECGSDSECSVLGAGLKCSSEIGTCMPSCTDQASCTGAGFARCDLTAGACDTL